MLQHRMYCIFFGTFCLAFINGSIVLNSGEWYGVQYALAELVRWMEVPHYIHKTQ
jgi:hypothetical protein